VSTLHEKLLAELDPAVPWDADRDERAYAALRAVVELHAEAPNSWGSCAECYSSEGLVGWPCSTIQAIARELGVDGA
jgi:hypothetical protein